MNRSCWQVATPVGWLTLTENAGNIVRLCFGRTNAGEIPLKQTALMHQAETQLTEYFAKERRQFTLPLAPEGTPFQRICWDALLRIPYGATRSYAWQAEEIGSPKAYRAVGMANHRNPLPILIPCHRVVGKSGQLTGYAYGLSIKQMLLELEASGCIIKANQTTE